MHARLKQLARKIERWPQDESLKQLYVETFEREAIRPNDQLHNLYQILINAQEQKLCSAPQVEQTDVEPQQQDPQTLEGHAALAVKGKKPKRQIEPERKPLPLPQLQ